MLLFSGLSPIYYRLQRDDSKSGKKKGMLLQVFMLTTLIGFNVLKSFTNSFFDIIRDVFYTFTGLLTVIINNNSSLYIKGNYIDAKVHQLSANNHQTKISS